MSQAAFNAAVSYVALVLALCFVLLCVVGAVKAVRQSRAERRAALAKQYEPRVRQWEYSERESKPVTAITPPKVEGQGQ
jgi:hypothetical protein